MLRVFIHTTKRITDVVKAIVRKLLLTVSWLIGSGSRSAIVRDYETGPNIGKVSKCLLIHFPHSKFFYSSFNAGIPTLIKFVKLFFKSETL